MKQFGQSFEDVTEDWLTVREAANLLNYTVQHVRRLIESHELIGQKFGPIWMVSRQSVADYRQRVGPLGVRKAGRPPKSKS